MVSAAHIEHTLPPLGTGSYVAAGARLDEAARARVARFQAEQPERFAALGITFDEAARAETTQLLAHVRDLEQRAPGYLAAIGTTAEEHTASMLEPGVTLEKAERLGWISPEERRLYEGSASLEDLHANGFSEEEAHVILREQEQDRTCASSS